MKSLALTFIQRFRILLNCNIISKNVQKQIFYLVYKEKFIVYKENKTVITTLYFKKIKAEIHV